MRFAGIRRDSPVLKVKEGFCSGACGVHWQGFKLDVKGEEQHIGLDSDGKYGVMHNGWRDVVLVQALSLLPRGMLGTLRHSQSLAEVSS